MPRLGRGRPNRLFTRRAVVLAAPPASSGLLTLETGPPLATTTAATSVTTAAFTPPVNAVLLSLSGFDTGTSDRTEVTTTVTGNTTAWTKLQHNVSTNGMVDINWAKVLGSVSTTVRSTWSASSFGDLYVPVITGADPTNPIGASGVAVPTGATTSITFTQTKANSKVFVVNAAFNTNTEPTGPAGMTVLATTPSTDYAYRAWVADTVPGTNTFTFTGTDVSAPLAWVEVVPGTATAVTATITEVTQRGRNDDGSQTTATWKAAAGAGWTQPMSTNFRVRHLIQSVGAAGSTADYQAHFSRNGGAWTPVTATSVVRAVASANLTEGAATTQQLGSGSFVAGTVDDLDGYYAGTTFAANQETELEGTYQIVGATDGDTIKIRMHLGNFAALGAYTTTPTITVGTPPVGNPKAETLVTDFSSDTGLFTGLNANNVISGGTLTMKYLLAYATVSSVALYDLTSSSVYAQVTHNTAHASNETWFAFGDPGGVFDSVNSLQFVISAGTLYARERAASVSTDVSIAYNATSMAWLRFRESGGTTYWETAPAATGPWTVQRSKANGFAPIGHYVKFSAGNFTADQTSVATFDNVNSGGAVAGTNYTATPADTLAATDAVTDDLGALRPAADTAALADAATSTGTAARTAADTAALVDAIVTELGRDVSAADTIAITDTASSGAVYTPAVADSAGLTDAVTDALAGQRTAADALDLTDAATNTQTAARVVADALAVTDTATGGADRPRTAADTVAVVDAVDALVSLGMFPADTAALADAVSVVGTVARTPADPLPAADAVVLEQVQSKAAADALPATDAVTDALAANRAPADTAGLLDAVSTTQAATPSPTDILGASDAVSAGFTVLRTAADPLAAADAAVTARDKPAADTAAIADAIIINQGPGRVVDDPIALTDGTRLDRSTPVADVLPLTDATALTRSRPIADTAGLTDAVTTGQTPKRTVADPVGITDAVLLSGSASRPVVVTANVVAEADVGARQVHRLRASVEITATATGNLVQAPTRAVVDITVTGELASVHRLYPELLITDISVDSPRVRVVRAMTDVIRTFDELPMGLTSDMTTSEETSTDPEPRRFGRVFAGLRL